MPAGKTIIHATLDPSDLNKDVPAKYGLIGDAQLTLTALSEGMANHDKAPAQARPASRSGSPSCARPGSANGRPSSAATRRRSIPTGWSAS